MEKELRQKVDEAIEQALHLHIKNIGSGDEAVKLLGEFVEYFYVKGNFLVGESFRPALDILMSRLLEAGQMKKGVIDVTKLVDKISAAAIFAGHYYSIRDLIYYSFALPNAVAWEYAGEKIFIRVLDPTIFRQLASERMSFHLNSSESFKQFKGSDPENLLRGTSSWDLSNPKVLEAFERISEQVEVKVTHFFSYIQPDSSVNVGGFKYREFLDVYKVLLFTSLYERFFSSANEVSCVITYREVDLSGQIAEQVGFNQVTVQKIIRDIASSSRGTFVRNADTNRYYLLPFSFSLKDSIGAVLKQFAQQDSNAFSAECGIIIGDSLVHKVASYFAGFRNFRIYKDIKLRRFGKHLPDIDIAAISYEPSLGFHIFISEIKNSLPASWAKEHLKSIGKKGFVDKAISQVEKLKEFFEKPEGLGLLKDLSLRAFTDLDHKSLFPNGFMVLVDYLVVTEQNIGMFFPNLNLNIISDDFLRAIVLKSDGDVNFIQYFLHNLSKLLDETYEKTVVEVAIGGTVVCYEASIMKEYFLIPQNEYLSIGKLEELEKESHDTGYTFFDCDFEAYLKNKTSNDEDSKR